MTYEQKVQNLIKEIPNILHEAAQMLEDDFPAYIEAEFHQKKRTTPFNNTDTLHSNRPVGGLAESFRLDSDNTASKIEIKSGGIFAEFGSKLKYAGVHEYGGFIRSKGKMHKFFWAQYAKQKNEFWKILALSVMSKGGVNIKPRPYLAPALKSFEKTGLKNMAEFILSRAKQIFEQ